jgi:hypothetical protein
MSQPLNKLRMAARVGLGALFFTFGLNGFVPFIPQPSHVGPAADYLMALGATGFMFPVIKGVELVTGLLLLTGRYVPLALTLLAPIVVNIVLFHLFLEPATLALPLVALGLGVYLAWTERSAFAPLFKPRLEVNARSGVARDLATST